MCYTVIFHFVIFLFGFFFWYIIVANDSHYNYMLDVKLRKIKHLSGNYLINEIFLHFSGKFSVYFDVISSLLRLLFMSILFCRVLQQFGCFVILSQSDIIRRNENL